MAEAKASREARRQLGQWMTPTGHATQIVEKLELTPKSRILEPSFGDGAFLLPLIERLLTLHTGSQAERFAKVMTQNVWGIEIDNAHHKRTLTALTDIYGPLPPHHNMVRTDFFSADLLDGTFDLIIGNPPYGGTFDPELEDSLDRRYGRWNGKKLKKETYSFFTARSLDLLAEGGSLVFIISDTMLTINTMSGLRLRLMDTTRPSVNSLKVFSTETTQPTLVLTAQKDSRGCTHVDSDGTRLQRSTIESTGNLSWRIAPEQAKYFGGPTLGDFIVCTSGMTIGKNELFVREISSDGQIVEPFNFGFFEDKITLENEIQHARLKKLSPKKQAEIRELESDSSTRRNVRVTPRAEPLTIDLPNPDYRPYNKMQPGIVFRPPKWAVYWRDNGDAVITFKKNGNWYLHGVGGRKFFEREGLTWPLISSRLQMRYLPSGYILDSGAPCAFLRDGVPQDELWFVLGWSLTSKATTLLKNVINHTRNIQSKDVEKLPYPWWVEPAAKKAIVDLVRSLVAEGQSGRHFTFDDPEIAQLDDLFAMRN